jgi:hypothetical protein
MTERDTRNDNRGVLFKNENKTEDFHGDMTGSITPVCENCGHISTKFLDGYSKTSQAGKKFLSLKVGKVKTGGSKPAPARAAPAEAAAPFDDDLPF